MENNKTILICDDDYTFLNQMERELSARGYDVDTIDNAGDLVPSAIRLRPNIILANPEMNAFNEYDVCKHIIKEQRVQIILVLNKHSSRRAQIGDCQVEDVLVKPINTDNLVNLLAKHIAVDQQ